MTETNLAPSSVASGHVAVDILLHQAELPGLARATAGAGVLESHSCPRLTARANLSSDDLAVIRHALTAVAEVKVRA